jgi:hypothetical protein
MPEAVSVYLETKDPRRVREVHDEILSSYELDFAKHASHADIPKISQIWHSVPRHLSKENRRFIFSAVHPSARSRDYENALVWLKDAGIIRLCHAIEKIETPLEGFSLPGIFKVYALDVGLLAAMARIDESVLVKGDEFFRTYHGAFVENYVAQELSTVLDHPLYYWKSEGKKAEVDFIVQIHSSIFPLEAKAEVNPKSKSLSSYNRYFTPKDLLRTTMLNLKRDNRIVNIPLYAIGALRRFTTG